MSPQRAAAREDDENQRRRWSAEQNKLEAERLVEQGRAELAARLYEANARLYRRVGDHGAAREAWRRSRELR